MVVQVQQRNQIDVVEDVMLHDVVQVHFLWPMFLVDVSAYHLSHDVASSCVLSMNSWCDSVDCKIRTHTMCPIVRVYLESAVSMSNSRKMYGDSMDIPAAH